MLLNSGELYRGKILKRPSAVCKTPYVADVLLDDGSLTLAHTASLGCCGLCDKDAYVYMIKVDNKKNICKYKIIIANNCERNISQLIGVDPKFAENIVNNCLQQNTLSWLKNIKEFQREKTYLNSRFDFCGIDENNQEFILEVKNVPLADYVDMLDKDKKKLDLSGYEFNNKIAYFPDGYRKKVKDTVSPRALKHIQELQSIKQEKNIRTILCFVIQRDDVSSFQPSNIDLIYKNAVTEAYYKGVEIKAIQVKWEIDGSVNLINDNLLVNIN